MESVTGVLIGSQLIFTIIASLYFYTNLKSQRGTKQTINLDSKKEIEKMKKLRNIKLTEPLSEKTRPTEFKEIIGQEKGIKSLRAALCGKNPQHVIIYGPPGIGKTAAARLVLKAAIESAMSPFEDDSPFIEMDATILQFDERSIADPLIGSVHDPIYQGAGAYGIAGIPQPKAGAVTKAHGGILFLDEIGELHQIQMNKLLKVLEDRKVFLSSSYYSSEDESIPKHIHDIFKNGFPADFRLIGATTRRPSEIPEALRSRCTEIFFRTLNQSEVKEIAVNTFTKSKLDFDPEVPNIIKKYATNGRDTVNIVQTASSIALLDNRNKVKIEDIEEVIESGRYTIVCNKKISKEDRIGVVNGLAVVGPSSGSLLEIEVTSSLNNEKGKGVLKVTGVIEEEEINSATGKMKRKSNAKGSVENVLTIFNKITRINLEDYNIHINFPGGTPIDGPSAGITIFTAIYSSIFEKEISSKIAMTGEISIKGKVLPVGGVPFKIEAAIESGVKTIIIPKDNYQKSFSNYSANILCIETVDELINAVFKTNLNKDIQTIDTISINKILTGITS